MKAILGLFIASALCTLASAKLSDFNTLIEENSRAQNELHSDLKQNMMETEVAVTQEKRERFLVDTSGVYNSPTRKGFLTYKKGKINYKASLKEAQKRLAQEIDSAE